MKRYLLSILVLFAFVVLGLAKSPSGELGEFDFGDNYKKFAVYKIVTGQTLKYFTSDNYLNTNKKLTEEEKIQNRLRIIKYEEYTELALKSWPLQTAEFIKKAGREKEFEDIMSLLSSFKVEKAESADKAHITYFFVDSRNNLPCPDAAGCYNNINIYVWTYAGQANRDSETYATTFHETGHYYGLADQYSTINSSVVYSNSDRVKYMSSVMASNHSKELSCDDVDGLIKNIDKVVYKMQGKYPVRSQKGWKSFCDDTVYVEGRVTNRRPYASGNKIYFFDKDGNIKEEKTDFAFDLKNKELIFDKGTGLLIKALDKENNLYTKYQYDFNREPLRIYAVTYDALNDNHIKTYFISRDVNKIWSEWREGYTADLSKKDECIIKNTYQDSQTWDKTILYFGKDYNLASYSRNLKYCRYCTIYNGGISLSYGKNNKIPQKVNFVDNSVISITRTNDIKNNSFQCEFSVTEPVSDKEYKWVLHWDKEQGYSVLQQPSSIPDKNFSKKEFLYTVKDKCSFAYTENQIEDSSNACRFFRTVEDQIEKIDIIAKPVVIF